MMKVISVRLKTLLLKPIYGNVLTIMLQFNVRKSNERSFPGAEKQSFDKVIFVDYILFKVFEISS